MSAPGLALIRYWEGCLLDAYQCPAGVWTVGFGHTKDVTPGMQITMQRALQWLEEDTAEAGAAIRKYVTVPLTENQFGALLSLVFNIGVPAFRQSTLLRLLNLGDYAAVPDQINRWNKVDRAIVQGLVSRRAAEARLWNEKDSAKW
jgi:lysozyme